MNKDEHDARDRAWKKFAKEYSCGTHEIPFNNAWRPAFDSGYAARREWVEIKSKGLPTVTQRYWITTKETNETK